jgi:hypothetical protein
MNVAKAYGERLVETGKNLSSDKLDGLISDYPSHSFVIDRIEAGKIFNNVRQANGNEQALFDMWGNVAIGPLRNPFVRFLSDEIPEVKNNEDALKTSLDNEQPVGPPAEAGKDAAAQGEAGTAAAG